MDNRFYKQIKCILMNVYGKKMKLPLKYVFCGNNGSLSISFLTLPHSVSWWLHFFLLNQLLF